MSAHFQSQNKGSFPSNFQLTRENRNKLFEIMEKLKAQDPNHPKIKTLLTLLRTQNQQGAFDGIPGISPPPQTQPVVPPLPPRPPTPISQNQLLQLKAQILAYKYLIRNLVLPPKLLTAIRNFHLLKSSQNLQKPSVPISHTPIISTSHKTPQTNVVPQTPETKPIPQITSTSSTTSTTTSTTHLNTVVMPDKLPLALIYQEREKRIKSRMASRLEELNSLTQQLPEDLKRKAMIEIKQLNLLEFQKKLRSEIVQHMRRTVELESSNDVNSFKKSKKGLKESKSVLEKNFKSQIKEAKVEKHKEFLAALQKHHNDFKQFHANIQKRKKKIAKEIFNYHSNEERKKEQQEQRRQRERLEALKQHDEEAYLKLLEDTKNTRLSLLLKQTDEYLEKISEMVKGQKDRDEIAEKKKELKEKTKGKGVGRGKKKEKDKDEKEGDQEKEEVEENEGKSEISEPSQTSAQHVIAQNKKYYATAHSIEEKTQQPDILIGGKLKSFQLVGLQWLVSLYNNNLNGILADEMGLGKTIQTISLISYLMEKKNDNGPYLIVVPLGTMTNWAMEFARWCPTINVVIYKGKPPVRRQIYKEEVVGGKYNVLLTSYEYVMIDKSDLGKIEWNYIIIDEGHRIKNKNSKLSNTLRQYMSRHRLLLTGTPLQNDLGELWSLLNFLLPNIFNSAENFQQWFNSPFAYAKGKKKENPDFIAPNEEETLLIINRLHKVLRPFLLRRLKKDVEHDLPDKVESILKCEMSALQKRMYKHMVERGMMLCDPDDPKGKRNKGFNNTLMQLQKICNHPYLFRDEYEIDESLLRVSGKFDLLDRILPKLRAAGHRVLIFNQMTLLMSIMEDYFIYRGYTTYLRLDGSTKSEERGTLVHKWNAPDSPYWIFILSTKAGGLGLNLQTADTVILFDTDWNPHMDLQAQDRVHRIGQQKEVRVLRLVTHNSIEERILERASFKLEVDAKVIQAGMFNTTANDRMRKDMLKALLYEEEDKEESELITSDEQVNSLIARTDEEYQLFQKMDKERDLKEEKLWASKGKTGPRPPRLMQEDELPEYLIQDLQDEDITLTYGRGRRERKEVQYEDNLTDLQFAKMVESGEITKKRRKEEDKTEEGRKKRRKDDDKSKKRKESEKSPKDVRRNPYLEQLNAKFEQIWTKITEETSPDGRPLSPIFMKLPSKRDYPDYFRLIKSPICLKQIKSKIDQCYYRSVYDFKVDFQTLFSNAQEYNVPGSVVYEDSVVLGKCFERELKKFFPEETKSEEESHIEIE